jgi:hypothetical protein
MSKRRETEIIGKTEAAENQFTTRQRANDFVRLIGKITPSLFDKAVLLDAELDGERPERVPRFV